MTPRPLAAAVLTTLFAVGLAGCTSAPPVATSPSASAAAAGEVPRLAVEEVVGGLEHGWDVGFLPDGRALVTQRPGRITLVSGLRAGSTASDVAADLGDLYVRSEGGLMGLVVHPDFVTSREFTTCQTHAEGGRPVDVRLVTWRLAADGASATRTRDLLTGLPISTGRHSGCRPTLMPDGSLVVGTGDTAQGDLPQDLTSLGGKTLRLSLSSGAPWPTNPYADAADVRQRYVTSSGHRNVQGVAVRTAADGTAEVWTAEHGPSEDDEVNRIRAGGNYGWDPSQGGTVGGYDESVPMTDTARFPDAVPAVWTTGATTQAVCGLAFLDGPQWGAYDGALAVTALKGAKLVLLRLTDDGTLRDVAVPTETDGPYGRLRAARTGPDGALYVTTSDGQGDRLLRIAPVG